MYWVVGCANNLRQQNAPSLAGPPVGESDTANGSNAVRENPTDLLQFPMITTATRLAASLVPEGSANRPALATEIENRAAL